MDVGEVRVGRLKLEPVTRQIAYAGGAPQTVEPRMMQVLLALAAALNCVVPPDLLFQYCWGARTVGPEALRRVVWRLRTTLRSIGADEVRIETYSNAGYRLSARP